MSKLEETWQEYTEARSALLNLRRELSESRRLGAELFDDAKQKRAEIIECVKRVAALLEEPTEKFGEQPRSDMMPLLDQMLFEYANLQHRRARIERALAAIAHEAASKRRRFRAASDALPPLLHSDLAGVLGNDPAPGAAPDPENPAPETAAASGA